MPKKKYKDPREILFDPLLLEKIFANHLVEKDPQKEQAARIKYQKRKSKLCKMMFDAIDRIKMSNRESHCFNEYFFKGINMLNIAISIGISRNSVRVYIKRALRKIKRNIKLSQKEIRW